jgi:vacuolar protein sorting-associated protein 13A/C
MGPLKLNLTFRSTGHAAETDAFIIFNMIVKALGCALTNIDEAPINLKGIKLHECFDTTDGITKKLITHYK